MLIQILRDWPVGTLLGVAMIVLGGSALVLIVLLVFREFDSRFRPVQRGTGRVVGKAYTPAHTSTIFVWNAATKTAMPTFVYHPDAWSVTIATHGQTDTTDIEAAAYAALKAGDIVDVEFVTGRFSSKLYIKGIYNPNRGR